MVKVELTQGYVAIIDDIDSSILSYKWRFNGGYAVTWSCKDKATRKMILMHKMILERKIGRTLDTSVEVTDHIDGNRLNNSRGNLRLASRFDNQHNRNVWGRNTSGYKGVSWCSSKRRWRAMVCAGGKSVHVGYFRDIVDAAIARDKMTIKLHGEFASLNFPELAQQGTV